MFGEILDTGPRERRRYFELLRGLEVPGRIRALDSASRGVRKLVEAGIRRSHPGIDEQELRVRVTVRLYGREIAQRLHWSVPDDAR